MLKAIGVKKENIYKTLLNEEIKECIEVEEFLSSFFFLFTNQIPDSETARKMNILSGPIRYHNQKYFNVDFWPAYACSFS